MASAPPPSSSLPETYRACRIDRQGDFDVLNVVRLPTPKPTSLEPNQVLIRTEWSGCNFIENYQRSGVYPVKLPFVLGNEPAGTVVAVGSDVAAEEGDLRAGDKVAAYLLGGGHAEYVVAERRQVAKLPDGVSTRDGATALLQGMTALTLVREAYPIQKGDWVLVHAAAGGVGLLLCQIASHLGATVIGTTSTSAKAELAKQNGASHVLDYTKGSVVSEVLRLTGGRGVQAVYDGVGASTWEDDFELVARKGTIVTFGNASGAVPAFAPLKLTPKNLKVCRPTLTNYVTTRAEFEAYATELFALLGRGVVRLRVHGEYEMEGTGEGREGARGIERSQRDITSRSTTGKLLIKVATPLP